MSKRILVADDELTVVALARQKLLEHGFSVEIARNGRAAMKIIDSMPIDLIVLDVMMPEMDGVDVYKELKKQPHTARIPIIIITDSRVFRESFQTLGVEHFLPKPLDAEKLINKVEFVFTDTEFKEKNKQVLVLEPDSLLNESMGRILEDQGLIVGRSSDSMDFLSTCLILTPKVIVMNVKLKGVLPAPEMIRSLRCFSRLRNSRILVYDLLPVNTTDNLPDIEQFDNAKNDCLDAGADKYIGRYNSVTFWATVKPFLG